MVSGDVTNLSVSTSLILMRGLCLLKRKGLLVFESALTQFNNASSMMVDSL